jgi:hypothetical protein
VPRLRRRRSRRRWPPFGFWLFATAIVVAIAQRNQRSNGFDVGGPVTDSVATEDDAARLADLVVERELAAPVSDEDLARAWGALLKRARSGRAGAVATLFAVARQQRNGRYAARALREQR